MLGKGSGLDTTSVAALLRVAKENIAALSDGGAAQGAQGRGAPVIDVDGLEQQNTGT
jgi:hypothetical protein